MPPSNKSLALPPLKQPALPLCKQPQIRFLAGAALIVGLVFWIYWPALHGGIIWDDEAHLTKPELRSLAGLGRIWFDLGAAQQYYPLLHTAFWAEHRLWGDAPPGYHLVNLLEHLMAVWLVYLILKQLTFRARFWRPPFSPSIR